MRPADAFLIIAGMYAAQSDWIEFELNFARRIGRPVIGIQKGVRQSGDVHCSRLSRIILCFSLVFGSHENFECFEKVMRSENHGIRVV